MSPRLRRALRLLELAKSALDSAQGRLVAASRAVAEGRKQAQRDEAVWMGAAQEFAAGMTSASAHEERSAHLRTLRLRADDSAKRLDAAIDEERVLTAALVEASTDHRKLELWRDRIVQVEHEETALQERRGEDELAARVMRTRP